MCDISTWAHSFASCNLAPVAPTPVLAKETNLAHVVSKGNNYERTCNRDHRKKFPPGSMKSRHLMFHLPKSLTLSLSSNHMIPRRGARDFLQSREHLLHLSSTTSSESPSRAQRDVAASPLPPSAGQRAPPPSPWPSAAAIFFLIFFVN